MRLIRLQPTLHRAAAKGRPRRAVFWARRRPRAKMRNILAKLPRMMQPKMKGLVHEVLRAPSSAVALKRGRDRIARFTDRYSAAKECLERDLEECVTHLRFP